MAGKGGGSWKVAYADFVTAMMAFFMVMWLVAQNAQVKEAVAKHFKNPHGRYAPGDALIAPKHEQYFKDRKLMIETGDSPPPVDSDPLKARKNFTVAITNGQRTLIGGALTFAQESAELDDTARQQLAELIDLMAGKPQKIEIRGHSVTPSGSAKDAVERSWQLCFARCQNTAMYLREKGIEPERFRLSQAGPFEPQRSGIDSQEADRNSRVDVFLLNEVTDDTFGAREDREKTYAKETGHDAAG